MEIKFKESLKSYRYLVMFDLASRITGVCVYDLTNNTPKFTETIRVKNECELPAIELEQKIHEFLSQLPARLYTTKSQILVCKEAQPVQLRGGNSTISTFIALARSHAILDTYLFKNEWPTYDYTGVYPISWHAYFKKVVNAPKDFKVDKQVVRDYNMSTFGFKELSLDESDAIFLCKTFIEVKWNNDIDEQVREVKRHKKTLKAPHAIQAADDEIERLKQLKM